MPYCEDGNLVSMPYYEGQPAIWYETHGSIQDAKSTIVLVCPFLTPNEYWHKHAEMLANKSYFVVTFDVRGHGKSKNGGAPWTYWDVAQDIIGIMDHLNIDKAIVGGTSQGGFVSLRCALLAPSRVKAIIPIATSARAYGPERRAYYQAMLDRSRVDPIKGAVDEIGDGMLQYTNAKSPFLSQYRSWIAQTPAEDVEPDFVALRDHDAILDRLSEIKCPTMVIQGSKDEAFLLEEGKEIAEAIPNARFEALDAPHSLAETHFNAVVSLFDSFLSTIP